MVVAPLASDGVGSYLATVSPSAVIVVVWAVVTVILVMALVNLRPR